MSDIDIGCLLMGLSLLENRIQFDLSNNNLNPSGEVMYIVSIVRLSDSGFPNGGHDGESQFGIEGHIM